MNKTYSIKSDFRMMAILIIPVAVAINFVGGQLANILKIPLYLDTIGTTLAALLCGPWIGALAGGLTNVVLGFTNPVFLAYIPVSVALGLVVGFLARGGMFGSWARIVISVLLMALTSIITAAPITVLMFSGITGSGPSLLVAGAMAAGANIWKAFIGTDGLATVFDRVIALFISYLVIKVIPDRTLIKYPCGENYLGKKTPADESKTS
jgi:energy-coupling factor transport system substrate-specific component